MRGQGSEVAGLGLVGEPDPARPQRDEQLSRLARVELPPGVSDVPGDHDQTFVGVDKDGLMPVRVSGSRQHSHAGSDLSPAVVLDVRCALEFDPRRDRVALGPRSRALDALHMDRGPGEEAVAAAMVEVQVRVDHTDDIAWDDRRVESDTPLCVELRGRVDHSGVHQYPAFGMLDHVDRVRPPLPVDNDVAVLDGMNVTELHRESLTDESRAIEESYVQITNNRRKSKGGEVAEWEKRIGAINLVVADVGRSAAFYRDVFGLPLQHEDDDTAMFVFGETYVFLQRGSEHKDAPAAEVLALAEKGVGQFAIIVGDVDSVRAELDQHGVAVISGPADRDWGMRTLTFADPGGHTWEIAQRLPTGPGPS